MLFNVERLDNTRLGCIYLQRQKRHLKEWEKGNSLGYDIFFQDISYTIGIIYIPYTLRTF
jgi:hypothetical protein